MDFHISELENIILFAKEDTSPRNDLINNFLIKIITPDSYTKIVAVFQQYTQRRFFSSCGETTILFYYPNLINQTSDLSLCLHVLKLLEKLIKSRLERLVKLDLLLLVLSMASVKGDRVMIVSLYYCWKFIRDSYLITQ